MKQFFYNFSFLLVAQVTNVLTILFSYPYLVNKLGLKFYGLIVVSQALADVIMVLTNFGFEISGLKEISKKENSINEINKTISSIIIIKSIVFIIAVFPVYLIGLNLLDIVENKFLIYYLFSGYLSALTPYFFFIAKENTKYILVLKIIGSATYLLLIFFLIREDDDYLYLAPIKLIVEILMFSISTFILVKIYKLCFVKVTLEYLLKTIKDSSIFFSSKLGNMISTKLPIFITKIVFGEATTAILDFIVKIYGMLQLPVDIISSLAFPKMIKTRNATIFKKMLLANLSLAILFTLIANIFLKVILETFFEEIKYMEIWIFFLIYSLVLIFNSISSILGTSGLVASGLNKEYNKTIYISLIILTSNLLFVKYTANVLTIYLAMISGSFTLMIYRWYLIQKNNLLR